MKTQLKKIIKLTGCLAFIAVVFMQQPTLYGLSQTQRDVFNRGIYYFDSNVTEANCSITGLGTSLSGNDNHEKTFRYFTQKGLTDAQSAGIVGNFFVESNITPTRLSGGGDSDTPPGTSPAWGIAQWLGNRQINLAKYAVENSVPVNDLGTQLAFAWEELNTSHKNALDGLKASNNPASAAEVIFSKYEIPLDGSLPKRQEAAGIAYRNYGSGTNLSVSVLSTSGSSDCSSITGSGQDTQYVDGFTVYNQCDAQWKNLPYGSGGGDPGWCSGANTIGASGCGPSAMAMIITNLTGTTVTPEQTASYADKKNQYMPGVGSYHTIAPVLAKQWGLKSEKIPANVADISASLLAGKLVIAAGQGLDPYTKGGHFIVIRGVTANGQWKIGDSGHTDTSAKDWDPAFIINMTTAGSVYAISR